LKEIYPEHTIPTLGGAQFRFVEAGFIWPKEEHPEGEGLI